MCVMGAGVRHVLVRDDMSSSNRYLGMTLFSYHGAPSVLETGFDDQYSSFTKPEVHAMKKIQPRKQVSSPIDVSL